MPENDTPPSERPRTSTRSVEEVLSRFAEWFGAELHADGPVRISDVRSPGDAGFSSETLLFEASWEQEGRASTGAYVLRLPPPDDAFPLFPWYEMDRQVSAMRFVGENSRVPVPEVVCFEPDPDVLGMPFFVMEQVAGTGVGDVPPYVFGSWVTEADDPQQELIRSGAVELLVGIHGIEGDVSPWQLPEDGETPLARHVARQRRYYDWLRGDLRYPIVDAAFEWLEARWPSNAADAVLSWGDARLANILWVDFAPVAVLDWEAVAVGPRELDLGWLVFHHEFFQRIAQRYGFDGAPHLLERDAVVDLYARRSGHQPVDVDWYVVYAELRQALTSIRVSSRAVHFGEQPAPDDPQDLIIDRAHLEEVVAP